jgi:hypothetical protein
MKCATTSISAGMGRTGRRALRRGLRDEILAGRLHSILAVQLSRQVWPCDFPLYARSVDVWFHVGSKNEAPGRTGFAHPGATSNAIATLYLQNLPQDYYQTFAAKINAVTKDDLVRVAKKYIDLEHLDIIIVGDRAVIEDPLRRTNIAPIVALDIDGKPVGTRVQP